MLVLKISTKQYHHLFERPCCSPLPWIQKMDINVMWTSFYLTMNMKNDVGET
jgi:hypothetical protein